MRRSHLTSLALIAMVIGAAYFPVLADEQDSIAETATHREINEDDMKKKPKGGKGKPSIDGEWQIAVGKIVEGKKTYTETTINPPIIAIDGEIVEWRRIPLITRKPGKGKIKVDQSRVPHTIELRLEEKTYKGIFRYGKEGNVEMLFSEPGVAPPAAFGKDRAPAPEGHDGYVITLSSPPAPPSEKPTRHTSKVFGFSITFPATPKVVQYVQSPGLEYYETVARSPETGVNFNVRCFLESANLDKQKARESLAAIAEKTSENRLFRSKKEIELGDVPGVELVFGSGKTEASRRDEYVRVYRVGRRTYQVWASGPAGRIPPKFVQFYFDSFKILKPGEMPRGIDEAPAKGLLLHDSFTAKQNGTRLTSHWLNTGPYWEQHGSGIWRIYDKRAKITPTAGQNVTVADAGAADGTLTCDMVTPLTEVKGMDGGLVVRFADNDNYWLVATHPDLIEIFKKKAGVFTSIAKAPYAFRPNTTYRMKVTASGRAISVFLNGTKMTEATMDDFLTATRFGLRDNSIPNRQPSWGEFKVTAPEK